VRCLRGRAHPLACCVVLAALVFAFPACGGLRLSPSSITPAELLAQFRRANTPWFGPDIYHLRYRTVSNEGEVSTSDYYGSGSTAERSDFRTTFMHAGSRVSRGKISGSRWQQSANGLVLPDADPGTIFDRIVRLAMHRADPRVRVLGVTQSIPNLYVLEVRPNARIFEREFFEKATFLLRKTEIQDYDGRIRTEVYNDYVQVGKSRLPSRSIYSDNISNQTLETTLAYVERLPFKRALLAMPKSRPPFTPQRPLPAPLNTIFGKRGILVRADVDGAPYWLEFDSGASGISLDRGFVQRLGLREFWKFTDTKGGRYESSAAVLPRMDVGPLYAENLAVGVLPLESREEGVDVVGLLGCDFIASVPLAIDFGKETVTALAQPPSSSAGWTAIRTPIQECRPSIKMQLNGHSANLLLDFGAEDTILNEDVLERLGPDLTQLDTKLITYVGRAPLEAVQYAVRRAKAGSIDLSPLVATVVKDGRGQDLNNDGVLGRNVLANYRIVLDYAGQRVLFHKDADAGTPQPDH